MFSKTLFRYGLVSGSAYLGHFTLVGIYYLLKVDTALIGRLTFLSFLLMSALGYFGHKYYTFRSDASFLKSSVQYSLVVTFGALASGSVGYLTAKFLSPLWLLPGQVIFAACWALLSATILKSVVFRSKKTKNVS